MSSCRKSNMFKVSVVRLDGSLFSVFPEYKEPVAARLLSAFYSLCRPLRRHRRLSCLSLRARRNRRSCRHQYLRRSRSRKHHRSRTRSGKRNPWKRNVMLLRRVLCRPKFELRRRSAERLSIVKMKLRLRLWSRHRANRRLPRPQSRRCRRRHCCVTCELALMLD